MEHFGAHADAFVEGSCADGTDHEFLEADGSVGVSAAVDDVHHGHGQSVAVASADVLIEGQVEVVGSGFGNSKAYSENGVCAEVALGLGAVKSEHLFVDGDLVKSAHAYESFGNGTVDVGHGFLHALAHVAGLVAVAQFESLVHAGGCAGGYGSTAFCAGFKDHVYFYSGVAAGVKYLTTNDFFNLHSLDDY